MRNADAPKKPESSLRSAGLLLLVGGIGVSAAMQGQHYEGPLHDLARLSTLAGIVVLIVAAVRNRRRN